MLVICLFVGCMLCFLVGYLHNAIMESLERKIREEKRKRKQKARRRLFTELKAARLEAFREV